MRGELRVACIWMLLAGTALADPALRLAAPVAALGELRLAQSAAGYVHAFRGTLRLSGDAPPLSKRALRLTPASHPLEAFQANAAGFATHDLRLAGQLGLDGPRGGVPASFVPEDDLELPPMTKRARGRANPGHMPAVSFNLRGGRSADLALAGAGFADLGLREGSASAPRDTLPLRSVIGEGIEQSSRLRGAMAEEGVARARVWRSIAAYAPTASGTFWMGDDPNTRFNAQSPPRTASLAISMPVFSGGQLYYGYKGAKANSRAAGHDVAATRDQLVLETLNAYVERELAGQQSRVLRENTANLVGLAGIIASRRQAGLAGNADVADVEAEIAESRRFIVNSDLVAAKAAATIEGLMGRKLAGGSPLPDLERVAQRGKMALVEMSRQRNPAILGAWERYNAADYSSRATYGKYMPKVDLFADYKTARNYRSSSSSEGWTVGLQLKVPLVELTTVAEIAESKEVASAAYYKAMDRARDTETRMAQSWEDYSGTAARVALAARKAGALRAALNARIEQFRIGLLPVDEVLAQNRKLANARMEEIEARMARYAALLRLASDAGLLQDIIQR